jgi:hypothetical protein
MRGIICKTIYNFLGSLWCRNNKKEVDKPKPNLERLPIKWTISYRLSKKMQK